MGKTHSIHSVNRIGRLVSMYYNQKKPDKRCMQCRFYRLGKKDGFGIGGHCMYKRLSEEHCKKEKYKNK